MKLYAISDLHLNYETNRIALADLSQHSNDWLIVAGDIGDKEDYHYLALSILTRRFAKVIWVPGNHDLWTVNDGNHGKRGQDKYMHLVSICRKFGVITPEDPYPEWPGNGSYLIVPLFLLYDYSFCPMHVSKDKAVEWATDTGIYCNDEHYLYPHPFNSVSHWCQERFEYSLRRLIDIPAKYSLILVNHFPLNPEPLERLYAIPRFRIWCGTNRTKNWHVSYSVATVVYGHLHIRSTDFYDNVRFEEVSLGYPRHWDQKRGIDSYLRRILPD